MLLVRVILSGLVTNRGGMMEKVTLKQVRSVVEMWSSNNRNLNLSSMPSAWHDGFVSACEAVLALINGDRKSSIREAERFVGDKDA
jgi:hypothetical protein